MLKKLTISQRLWILAIINLATIVAMVGEVFYVTNTLSDDLTKIVHADIPALRNVGLADMYHEGLVGTAHRIVMVAQEKDAKAFKETQEEFAEQATKITELIQEIKKFNVNSEINHLVDVVMPDIEKYIAIGEKIINVTIQKGPTEGARHLEEMQAQFEKLEESLGKLVDTVEATAQADTTESVKFSKKARKNNIIISLIGLSIGLGFSIFINLNLMRALSRMTSILKTQNEKLGQHIHRIEESTISLRDSSQQQSGAVQQTAAALEEIKSMVSKTSDNSNRLATSSKSSHQMVEAGRQGIEKMGQEMDSIKQSNLAVMKQIEESNNQIKSIVQVIAEIGEKTKVINEIVFQTKLLSFNASVEAARAGEHGKGFAVVAEEVGNLAQVSGNAAKEITQMLEKSIAQVNSIVDSNSERISQLIEQNSHNIENGQQAANECRDIFDKIFKQVTEVHSLTEEIEMAIMEQRTGLEEINRAIQTFSSSAKENADTAEGSHHLVGELRENSQKLLEVIERFHRLTGGRRHNDQGLTTVQSDLEPIKQAA